MTITRRLMMCLGVVLTLWPGTGCQLPPTPPALLDDQRNQAWHVHYQDGWEAVKLKNYAAAEKQFLLALEHAEHFESTDRRLAETLDDLGLVYYQLGLDFLAEQMQGRAVTQLLLARGPSDSDVAVFLARLGHIYERQDRTQPAEQLTKEPFRIFEMGYVAQDAHLAAHLDALIYEYERAGHTEATEYLSGVAYNIRHRHGSTGLSR